MTEGGTTTGASSETAGGVVVVTAAAPGGVAAAAAVAGRSRRGWVTHDGDDCGGRDEGGRCATDPPRQPAPPRQRARARVPPGRTGVRLRESPAVRRRRHDLGRRRRRRLRIHLEDRRDAAREVAHALRSERLERIGQLAHVLEAFRRVFLEAADDHGIERRRDVRLHRAGRGRRVRRHFQTELGERLRDERRAPRDELEQHRAQRPDVGPDVDVLRRAELLGRHVERRADDGRRARERELQVDPGRLGDPEVEHLDEGASVHAPREEDVVRLDVAMDDPRRVRLGHGFAGLHDV